MGIKIEHCTSCGSKDIEVAGNKYLCRQCSVVYEVTEAGTFVSDSEPLSKEREEIKQLRKDVNDLQQQGGRAENSPGGNEETEIDDKDDDEEEQDGFIIWDDQDQDNEKDISQ